MGRLALLALLLAAASPAGGEADLPFHLALDPSDAAAFERCAAGSGGVAVTWSLPPSVPSGRVDLLEQQKGFPRWRWRGCAAIEGGFAVLAAAPGARAIVLARAPDRDTYLLDGPLTWPGAAASRRFDASGYRNLAGEGTFPKGALAGFLLSGLERARPDPLCESDGEFWQCAAVPAVFRGVLELCPSSGEHRFAAIDGPNAPAQLQPAESAGLPIRLEVEGGAPAREPAFRLVRAYKHGYRPVPGLTTRPLGGTAYWIGATEPPKDALLEVSADGLATRRLPLDGLRASAACGEMAVVELPLAWEIAGRVLDRDGSPMPGSTILLREPGAAEQARKDGTMAPGGRLLQEVSSEATGAFRITRLEEQPYLVRACHPSRRCKERLVRPPFEPLEIKFDESGILRGRVLSASGAPEPAASIEVTPNLATAQAAEDTIRLVSLPVSADAQGRFEIAVQSTGTFELEASAPGGGAARREIAVSDIASAIDLGDIRLSRGGAFRARVPGCGGGELFLVGPMNASSLPQMKRFALSPEAQTVVELPVGGEWLTGARCGGQEKYLQPDSLPRVEELWDMEIVFEIRPDDEPDAEESESSSR